MEPREMYDSVSNTMLADLKASGQKLSAQRSVDKYYQHIEECLAAGYRHEAIHAWLVGAGLEISFKYYLCILARLRIEKRKPVARRRENERISTPAATAIPKGSDFRGEFKSEPQHESPTFSHESGNTQPFKWDPLAASTTDWKNF